MKRRLARLRAVQALYQIDLTDCDADEALESVVDKEEGEKLSDFTKELVYGTLENLPTLDRIISESLQGWTLDRLGYMERAIVRMALYEMNYIKDIPVNVSFNEGIELAKAFGGEEASRFVNGVLSKAYELFQQKIKEKN